MVEFEITRDLFKDDEVREGKLYFFLQYNCDGGVDLCAKDNDGVVSELVCITPHGTLARYQPLHQVRGIEFTTKRGLIKRGV